METNLEFQYLVKSGNLPLASQENHHLGSIMKKSMLFHQHNETIDHLLNAYTYNNDIWDRGSITIHQYDQVRDSIKVTIAS